MTKSKEDIAKEGVEIYRRMRGDKMTKKGQTMAEFYNVDMRKFIIALIIVGGVIWIGFTIYLITLVY